MRISKYLAAGLISLAFLQTACTDVIDIELDEGTPQLNVDAFINDKAETQRIRLVMTTNYFDNGTVNPVKDAIVKLSDDAQHEWTFTYEKDGYYILPYTDTIIRTFYTYNLFVEVNGKSYTATTMAMPTVPVDSITFQEQKPTGPGSLDGFIGEFWGRDLPGMTNFYWIKTYKNGKYLSDPNFINLSYDAAQGEGSDGLTFIPPIRTGITTFPDIYKKGDVVRVEILSITAETYEFIIQAQSQITNGGLFATPPYNVVTNIQNTSGSQEVADRPVGWFSVSAIQSMEAVAGN